MVLRKSYLDKIIPFIDQDLIKVLVGIRRCGKTVLLGQIKDVLLQRSVPAQNIIQANFESMRFRSTHTAEALYDYISEKAAGCSGKIYILLDEIQEVDRWQVAINSLRVDFDCDILSDRLQFKAAFRRTGNLSFRSIHPDSGLPIFSCRSKRAVHRKRNLYFG